MQIVKIMGGLGNQMFQAAFSRSLSKKLGQDVLIDISAYDSQKTFRNTDARTFMLDVYNTNMQFAQESQTQACISGQIDRKSGVAGSLKHLLDRLRNGFRPNIVKDKSAGIFKPDFLTNRHSKLFSGYFQSEKYFKDIRKDILEMFTLKPSLNIENQEMLSKINDENSVSLHVRRGDYLNLQDKHGLCSLDYYKKAVDHISQRVQNPHFFLFSDDVDWVAKNLKLKHPCTVVDINDSEKGYFDIELMRNCKHNITANSSFSWWGAWLNNSSDKIVVAPEKWFVGKKMPYDDIVPESWVKIG